MLEAHFMTKSIFIFKSKTFLSITKLKLSSRKAWQRETYVSLVVEERRLHLVAREPALLHDQVRGRCVCLLAVRAPHL